jgi:uncharacterized protein HemY
MEIAERLIETIIYLISDMAGGDFVAVIAGAVIVTASLYLITWCLVALVLIGKRFCNWLLDIIWD